MKDAFGHGSNGGNASGAAAKTPFHYHGSNVESKADFDNRMRNAAIVRSYQSTTSVGDFYQHPDDKAAAASLASGPKSAAVPVHDGAAGPSSGTFRPNAFGNGPSHADDPKLG